MPQAMSRPQNPLTEEQAKEAEAKGAAARVMRQQHGLSIAPWEVAGLGDAGASAEDLRYQELRERWDELRLEVKDEYASATEPLAAHRQQGAALARAWRLVWACLEVTYGEWGSNPTKPDSHLEYPVKIALNIRQGATTAAYSKLRVVARSLPQPPLPQPRGFPFDLHSEFASVVDQLTSASGQLGAVLSYLESAPSSWRRAVSKICKELGDHDTADDGGPGAVASIAAMNNGPYAHDSEEVQRALAALAAIEAAIVTRRPLGEIFVGSFISPQRLFDTPKAVRWTAEPPPKTGALRGYPVNKRGQFDALAIMKNLASAVQFVFTWMWKPNLPAYSLAALMRSATLWAKATERHGVEAAWMLDAFYQIGPLDMFIQLAGEDGLDDARGAMATFQRPSTPEVSDAVWNMAAVVCMQKGQTTEAARACMRLAADFQRDIDEAMKAANLR